MSTKIGKGVKNMKLFRNIFLSIVALVSLFAFSPVALATAGDPYGTDPLTEVNLPQADEDIRVIIVRLINLALSFLGLVSVILILWGGFKWMTAGGNDEQVGEAKKIIIAAVIGLAIIISAWAITRFFTAAIYNAVETGDTSGTF